MKIFFKVEAWYESDVDDNLHQEKLLQLQARVEEDQITSNEFFDEGFGQDWNGWRVLPETEEDLRPYENNGQATIELQDDDGVIIASNEELTPPLKVAVDEESVNIYFDNGEDKDPTHIAYWHEDEWLEDPKSVVPAIIRAMYLAYNDKEELLKILKPIV